MVEALTFSAELVLTLVIIAFGAWALTSKTLVAEIVVIGVGFAFPIGGVAIGLIGYFQGIPNWPFQ